MVRLKPGEGQAAVRGAKGFPGACGALSAVLTGRAGLAGAVRGAGHRAVYGALSAVLKPKAPGASWKKGLLA